MFFLLFIGGKSISRHNDWKYWLLPIIAFTLNEGLRFARGTDYIVYARVFETHVNGDVINIEPLWHFICWIVGGLLHLPWPAMVFLMSFFMILSSFFYLKEHKNVLCYALPLFAYQAMNAENLARWFFAFSFVLIAISFYENEIDVKKKRLYSLLFLGLALLIHYGIILVEIFVVLLATRKKVLFTPGISVILLILVYLTFSPDLLGNFTNFAYLLNFGGRFDSYTDNISQWVESSEDYSYSYIDLIVSLIYINVGYKLVKKYPQILLAFNVGLIGCILAPFMRTIEMTWRISACLTYFQFIIFAYMMAEKRGFSTMTYRLQSLVIIFVYLRVLWGGSFKKTSEEVLYLWDVAFNYDLISSYL